MATNILWIVFGGAMGALLRTGVSVSAIRLFGEHFPYGTLLVNAAGSFLIGILWAFHEKEPFSENAGVFIFVGLLGAFTTFSTFSLDTMRLLQEGRHFAGVVNVISNNAGALGGVFLGYLAGRFLRGWT